MDSVKPSAVITLRKSRLALAFAKVLHIRALTEISRDDEIKNTKPHENSKKNHPSTNAKIPSFSDVEDEKLLKEAAFVAKLFASLSTVKAAYAQLQFSQSPYDPDGIQSADQTVVSELKSLSELKQSYLKNNLDETSPERTLLLSEIQEQKSLLKIYEITSKKLDYQLKLRDSEITFLKEKLAESHIDNKSLEKRLKHYSNGQLYSVVSEKTKSSSLRPSHFVAFFRHTMKSIRSFVRLLIDEMQSAGWDLDTVVGSIQPGVSFWRPTHICFAFESFVSSVIFDGFDRPDFSTKSSELEKPFLDQFLELRSVEANDYVAWNSNSAFAEFCRAKYLRLVHPKLEESLFGDLEQRSNLVGSGAMLLPETTPFFTAFGEMAKRVWLLHCLAFLFDPTVSVFQVRKGSRFSDVYMESLSDEAFDLSDDPRVAFVVAPGFRIGGTLVQCQVYLC